MADRKLKALFDAAHFKCPRFHVTLSRGTCVKMYRKASGGTKNSGREAISSTDAQRCAGCDVGAKHRRGEVAEVELVTLTSASTTPMPTRKRVSRFERSGAPSAGNPLPRFGDWSRG